MRSKLTHDQHVVLAEELCTAQRGAQTAFFKAQEAFGKSHRSCTALRRSLRDLSAARAALDTEYHQVTTDGSAHMVASQL